MGNFFRDQIGWNIFNYLLFTDMFDLDFVDFICGSF